MIAAFMAVNTYLIDAFTMYAASAMAANTILRSVRIFSDDVVGEAGWLTVCTDFGWRISTFRVADVQCSWFGKLQ